MKELHPTLRRLSSALGSTPVLQWQGCWDELRNYKPWIGEWGRHSLRKYLAREHRILDFDLDRMPVPEIVKLLEADVLACRLLEGHNNKAIESQELRHGSRSETIARPQQRKARVLLAGPGESPVVDGVRQGVLTKARYNVVQALLDAGPQGLSKDQLVKKSGHGSAVNILKQLAGLNSAWKQVIRLPQTAGMGYALRFK